MAWRDRIRRRYRREDSNVPPWWRPAPTGKPVFDPSLRTAAELAGLMEANVSCQNVPPNAA
jgi:hypothetical protein